MIRRGPLSYATPLLSASQPIRAPVSGKGTIKACVSCPCEPACRERPSVHSCHEHQTWICAPTGWPRRMPSRKSRPRAPIQVPAGVVTARGTREDRTMADETIHWFAGVDWGSAKHQVCLLDRAGNVVGEREFAHGGAGLAALCDWLVSVAGEPGSVAVAIEVPHGPVVDALLDRGFAVYAINPKQLERLRDRVSLAGAKDDRRDARVAAGGLRTDPHLFRPVEAGDPAVIALREWSRLAEELQQERVRLSNRIRQQLWRYYPQLLEVSDDVTAEWVLDLWTLAPTPAKAARLREATLARLLQEHRIRRLEAEQVHGLLRQSAIKVAEGVTEAAVLHLRSLVARLCLANREFHQAERKLDELCTNLRDSTAGPKSGGPRDAAVLSSLPGISARSPWRSCSPRPPG